MQTKQQLRERIWETLQRRGAARFPGTVGRIPNFEGATEAAELACRLQVWQRARVLKCNPDSPQLPLRRAALREGKTIYMAVPRLRQERCFIELDPERLGRRASAASSPSPPHAASPSVKARAAIRIMHVFRACIETPSSTPPKGVTATQHGASRTQVQHTTSDFL